MVHHKGGFRPRLRLLLALLGLGLAAHGVRAQEGDNLVSNPGFESLDAAGGPVGWTLPQPVYAVVTDVWRTGARALRYVNADAARYQLASCALPKEPGAHYEFEVWVRTENVQGDDSGATVCLEWYDTQGGYLGGAYPAGVKGSNSAWTRVHGESRKTPENAERCTVTCYVRKGMTGTAWFDDVAVRRYQPPLLTGATADRHRGVYAGGPAEILIGVEAPVPAVALELSAVVLDSAGNTVASPRPELRQADLAALRVDTTPLAAGLYTVRIAARSPDGSRKGEAAVRLTRVTQPVPRRVTIDEFGRTLVDGEPFFPLGAYWAGINEEQLKLYAASAFNCLMPYGSPSAEEMDLAQRHGLKVIYSIKDYYAGTTWCPKSIRAEADEQPAVAQTVTQFRAHPALLAWYLNDELPADMIGRLAAHQQWVEELDPDHPTWVVLYQVDDLRRYLPSFDVIGTDPYPIPGEPISMALDWTRRTHQGVFGRRAVWQVPQIFNYAAYREGAAAAACRAPTLLEMRSMAWQCIAGGANGLVFYSWFDVWKMKDKDPFEQRWSEITAMAAEIKRLFPVLLSVEALPSVAVSAPAAVAWRGWRRGPDLYLLVVNSAIEPAEAIITLPSAPTGVTCEFGAGSGTLADRRLVLGLGTLEPRLLKITLGP
jgi:hypothetical protein